jgi:hypothetical protein
MSQRFSFKDTYIKLKEFDTITQPLIKASELFTLSNVDSSLPSSRRFSLKNFSSLQPMTVSNLEFIQINPTTGILTWDGIAYTSAQVIWGGGNLNSNVIFAPKSSITIHDLQPDAQYNFQVIPYSSAGNPGKQKNMNKITGASLAAANINYNRTKNQISTTIQKYFDGYFSSLEVSVKDIATNQVVLTTTITNGDFIANNLLSNKQYEVTITPFNSENNANLEQIVVNTLRTLPNLEFESISSSSSNITLNWSGNYAYVKIDNNVEQIIGNTKTLSVTANTLKSYIATPFNADDEPGNSVVFTTTTKPALTITQNAAITTDNSAAFTVSSGWASLQVSVYGPYNRTTSQYPSTAMYSSNISFTDLTNNTLILSGLSMGQQYKADLVVYNDAGDSVNITNNVFGTLPAAINTTVTPNKYSVNVSWANTPHVYLDMSLGPLNKTGINAGATTNTLLGATSLFGVGALTPASDYTLTIQSYNLIPPSLKLYAGTTTYNVTTLPKDPAPFFNYLIAIPRPSSGVLYYYVEFTGVNMGDNGVKILEIDGNRTSYVSNIQDNSLYSFQTENFSQRADTYIIISNYNSDDVGYQIDIGGNLWIQDSTEPFQYISIGAITTTSIAYEYALNQPYTNVIIRLDNDATDPYALQPNREYKISFEPYYVGYNQYGQQNEYNGPSAFIVATTAAKIGSAQIQASGRFSNSLVITMSQCVAQYIYVEHSDGRFIGKINNPGANLTYTVTGLVQGTTYNFKLTPYNIREQPGSSVNVSQMTVSSLPLITTAQITHRTTTSITVSWTIVDGDNVTITWGSTGTSGVVTGNSYVVTGLVRNTQYTIAIRPYRVSGNLYGNVYNVIGYTAPITPDFNITSLDVTTALMQWTDTGGYSYLSAAYNNTTVRINSPNVIHIMSGLSPNTTYIVDLTTYNVNDIVGNKVTRIFTTMPKINASYLTINTAWKYADSIWVAWGNEGSTYGQGTHFASSYRIVASSATDSKSVIVSNSQPMYTTVNNLSGYKEYTITVTPRNIQGAEGLALSTIVKTYLLFPRIESLVEGPLSVTIQAHGGAFKGMYIELSLSAEINRSPTESVDVNYTEGSITQHRFNDLVEGIPYYVHIWVHGIWNGNPASPDEFGRLMANTNEGGRTRIQLVWT